MRCSVENRMLLMHMMILMLQLTKSAMQEMQRRESYVEMNINAYDDTNATSGIDDADRVSSGDEYHQL